MHSSALRQLRLDGLGINAAGKNQLSFIRAASSSRISSIRTIRSSCSFTFAGCLLCDIR